MHQEILVIKKGCHRDILWGIMSGEPVGGLKPLSPREGSTLSPITGGPVSRKRPLTPCSAEVPMWGLPVLRCLNFFILQVVKGVSNTT